jgi:hypothetical protein
MPFEPGISGNPEGRPKGIRDNRVLFADMLNDHKDALFNKAVEMALNGNEQMLKLLLERMLPAKPKSNAIELEGFEENSTQQQVNAVMNLMCNGKVSIETAENLLTVLAKKAMFTDLEALKERLAALEKDNFKKD